MSKNRESAKSLKGRPGYEVGYAKPPKDTRFTPGQSGNPKGRPRGSQNKKPDMHEERMKEIVLEEAYRGIAVRDGDRTVTLPIVQAVMRSLGINAAKGQARSQRLFVELLATVEGSRKMALLHKSVRDSSRESSVVAGMHEQTHTSDLQDQELASLQ